MPRVKKITRWPAELREAIDGLIRDHHTIDEIMTKLAELGAPKVARSTVGEYAADRQATFRRIREAQEVAGMWAKKFLENPESDVGLVLQEMLKTITFQSLSDTETLDPRDIMFMGKALKDLASAQKVSNEVIDRALARRQAQLEAQAEKAKQEIAAIAKPAGLSDDTIAAIHAALSGAIA